MNSKTKNILKFILNAWLQNGDIHHLYACRMFSLYRSYSFIHYSAAYSIKPHVRD